MQEFHKEILSPSEKNAKSKLFLNKDIDSKITVKKSLITERAVKQLETARSESCLLTLTHVALVLSLLCAKDSFPYYGLLKLTGAKE